jgi:hypothetical protein
VLTDYLQGRIQARHLLLQVQILYCKFYFSHIDLNNEHGELLNFFFFFFFETEAKDLPRQFIKKKRMPS